MAIDTDTLLAPVDADNPCGDNLEYDADFLAMARAAAGKAEQQFGSTIIPEEAPDWVQVERLATSLLARTKDLRVMLYLTRAWTQLRGLPGYADGLTLIHQSILRYWDALQPALSSTAKPTRCFASMRWPTLATKPRWPPACAPRRC